MIRRQRTERSQPAERSPVQEQHHAWPQWRTHLVPSYSQLKLTKDMDRLPALSAVARGLESVCGKGEYVAGMWLSDLAISMTWRAGAFGTNGLQPGRLPSEYRAPSWGWASIEGPVDSLYDYEDEFEPICSVESVEFAPAGSDPFSNAAAATARVHGHLLPGVLKTGEVSSKDGSKTTQYLCIVNETEFHLFPDTPLAQSGSSVRRSPLQQGEPNDGLNCPVYLLAVLMARPRRNTGFVDETDAPTVDFTADRWVTFLVLTRLESPKDTYSHIGLMVAASSKLPDQWFDR